MKLEQAGLVACLAEMCNIAKASTYTEGQAIVRMQHFVDDYVALVSLGVAASTARALSLKLHRIVGGWFEDDSAMHRCLNNAPMMAMYAGEIYRRYVNDIEEKKRNRVRKPSRRHVSNHISGKRQVRVRRKNESNATG